MFMHIFEKPHEPVFKYGCFPKINRVSNSCNNPYWYYTLHSHNEQVELMYIASGKALITVGHTLLHVGPGDILFIDKNILHSVESSPDDPSDIWCCIIGEFEFASPEKIDLSNAVRKSGSFENIIRQIFTWLHDFSYQGENAAQGICEFFAINLLYLYYNLFQKDNIKFEVEQPSFAQEILMYINEHYNEEITLESLSNVFFVSETKISHDFKKEYNISPINYLIDKRIGEARWLLLNTNETVYSIAERVGYKNYYYFNKLFRMKAGITPAEYREKNKHDRVPWPEIKK